MSNRYEAFLFIENMGYISYNLGGKDMPTICNFLGIVICMYFLDHYPPHIHVAS